MMSFRALFALPLLAALALAQDPASAARKVVDLMLAGKYEEITPLLTPEVQKDLPPANLAKLGAQFQTMGAMEKVGDPQTTKSGPNTIVLLPVKFATRTLNFRFLVNASGLVSQFVVQPGAVEWTHPAYSNPDSFTERAVTVGDGDWKLPGTLTVPKGSGPFPAVVLVHGSGPNDRDETVGGVKVFKDLAEGLSSKGIVVLRYEKRTKQYQARAAALKHFTLADETVDDAAKAAEFLRTQKEVDPAKVWVLGHSLGGYAAPRIADEDGKLAGLILMAANVRPMEDLVIDQLQWMGAQQSAIDQAKAVQAKVKKLEPGDDDGPAVMGAQPSYWLDLKGYNPAEKAKSLGIPLLILQGERDYQVTMKEFELWKAAVGGNKNVTMKSYPALNHLFVAGEGKSMPAEYNKPGHVDAGVIDEIAGVVKK
jgi:dienelactone hydrolase